MGIDLDSLGFTQAELQERVIAACVRQVFECSALDEDGDEFLSASPLARRLESAVSAAIDAKVAEIAGKHVLPLTESYIENLTLQERTKWGDKVGQPVTFVEYLISRAESYLTEEVDFTGKAKGRSDSYNWKPAQSRLTHLVHEHLHYSIETAMKQAVASANAIIVGGIAETVKIKLGEISTALRVEVKTK